MLLPWNSRKSRPNTILICHSRCGQTRISDAFLLFFFSRTCSTEKLGENSPEIADLYFAYGRALLENAIVQNSVLGKEQTEESIEEQNKGTYRAFSFQFFC